MKLQGKEARNFHLSKTYFQYVGRVVKGKRAISANGLANSQFGYLYKRLNYTVVFDGGEGFCNFMFDPATGKITSFWIDNLQVLKSGTN